MLEKEMLEGKCASKHSSEMPQKTPFRVSLNHPGSIVTYYLCCWAASRAGEVKEKAAGVPAETTKRAAAAILRQRKK